MFARIWNLVVKEFIQFGRDRLLVSFILLLPALQLVLLAQSTGRRIGHLPLAVLDLDRSRLSRELTTLLDNTKELDLCCRPTSLAELRELLDQDRADIAVVIPRGFMSNLTDVASLLREAQDPASQVQIIADGSNSIVGAIGLSAAQNAVSQFGRELAARYGITAAEPIDLRINLRYNRTLNTRHFAIPAQLGFITYQVTLAIAALGLARERELGTLEQLMVAPLRRFELITGKAIPAFVIGSLNFLLMLAIAVFAFEVPLTGSPLLLVALTFVFVAAQIGWGVLISGIARTQQQAILFVFILAMLDMTFSGYMVPVESLPWLLQIVAQAVPMQHYLVIVRGIMVKGATLRTLWPHVAALVALGVGMGVIALRGVSRRLD